MLSQKESLSLSQATGIVQRHVCAVHMLTVCAWREMSQAEVPKLASCRAMPVGLARRVLISRPL